MPSGIEQGAPSKRPVSTFALESFAGVRSIKQSRDLVLAKSKNAQQITAHEETVDQDSTGNAVRDAVSYRCCTSTSIGK